MKYTKAAAVVAGTMLAVGAGAPAFADDVDNAPAAQQAGNEQLVDSSTVSKNEVKNPLKDVNVEVVSDAVSKAADKLATNNDLASKTKALGSGAKGAAGSLPGSGLIGGMPIGG
ncbi:hypothetical protein ACQB60_04730 [Actinomycetota bacterium Odt1-20B]